MPTETNLCAFLTGESRNWCSKPAMNRYNDGTHDTGSPESRIAFAHIEGNDFTAIYSKHGTVWLDSLTFGTRDRQYRSLDGSS